MKKIIIDCVKASSIIQGCMRISEMSETEVEALIKTDLEAGINFFDHADIYGGGKSEKLFGTVLLKHPDWRSQMIIQTKGSIKFDGVAQYDCSKEHIIECVTSSLKRLNTPYIDYFLLHRPDALLDPKEVGEAFDYLFNNKLVKHFGVSNFNASQIALLRKHCERPLVVNQLQFSLMHTLLIDTGLYVNTKSDEAINRDSNILDYCYLNDITIQAWSPFQYGTFEGTFLDNPMFLELNLKLKTLANKYETTINGIATAWILRHPSNMQVVIGTTNLERIKDIAKASEIILTRREWYDLYNTAKGHNLP